MTDKLQELKQALADIEAELAATIDECARLDFVANGLRLDIAKNELKIARDALRYSVTYRPDAETRNAIAVYLGAWSLVENMQGNKRISEG